MRAKPGQDGRSELQIIIAGHQAEPPDEARDQCRLELRTPTVERAFERVARRDEAQCAGEIMNSSWKLYTQELGLMIGAAVIMMILPMLVILPCGIPIAITAAAAKDEEAVLLILIPALIILVPILLAFTAAMQLGNMKLYLNISRGDGPTITDIFWGFSAEGRPPILPPCPGAESSR